MGRLRPSRFGPERYRKNWSTSTGSIPVRQWRRKMFNRMRSIRWHSHNWTLSLSILANFRVLKMLFLVMPYCTQIHHDNIENIMDMLWFHLQTGKPAFFYGLNRDGQGPNRTGFTLVDCSRWGPVLSETLRYTLAGYHTQWLRINQGKVLSLCSAFKVEF